jgi:hypothetical protein
MGVFRQAKMIARLGAASAARQKTGQKISAEKFNILIHLGAAFRIARTAIHSPHGVETRSLL